MKKKFFAVATFAFAFAFALSASAVGASEIYSASSGYLKVGSGMGAMAYQAPNVMAAQKALNACQNSSIAEDGKFGPITADLFKAFQTAKGIKIDGIIGSQTAATLAACSGGSNTPTPSTPSTLNGGAGDLSYSATSTDVESTVKEGTTENVLGLKLEADGSDIAVSSVKVEFDHSSGTGSTRLYKYVDEVVVMLGNDEVGSMSAEDFSKDGTVYSKSIPLTGAVVDEDAKENLYIAVKTLGTVDNVADEFDVTLTQVRWMDATGAIFSDTRSDSETFGFDDANADDDIAIKSSTTDPDATNLIVETDASSDEYLVGAFKLDVDDNSSDITVIEMPVVFTFAASGNTTDDAFADSSENFLDEVRVEIDGEDYVASYDSEATTNSVGTGTYIVDDEFVIDAGDAPVVKIYATFNEQDGNYGSGATIIASVTGSDIDAEGEDEVTVTSSFTGEEHTLLTTGAAVTYSSASFTAENATDSIDGTISLVFKVEAVGEDVVFADDGTDFTYSLTGATETDAIVTCSGLTASGGDFTVAEGDTKTCTLAAKFNTTTGFVRLEITDVAGTTVNEIITPAY